MKGKHKNNLLAGLHITIALIPVVMIHVFMYSQLLSDTQALILLNVTLIISAIYLIWINSNYYIEENTILNIALDTITTAELIMLIVLSYINWIYII